jgi:hypothetical protein
MYTFPTAYRHGLSSHSVGIPKIYWNHFSAFLLLGFRENFAIFNPVYTNFFLSKASDLIYGTCSRFYSRAMLFGFFDDYESEQVPDTERDSDDFIIFYKLFLKTYNIVYRGFFWKGGGLSNFRKFRRESDHFFLLPRKILKYRYYPSIVFSTYYSYSTFSLGFESLCSKVPLISPVNPSVDPSIFGYPIPINSASSNIYFFSNFYFVNFFLAFSLRFRTFEQLGKFTRDNRVYFREVKHRYKMIKKKKGRRKRFINFLKFYYKSIYKHFSYVKGKANKPPTNIFSNLF